MEPRDQREELDQLPYEELLRLAAREILIAVALLCSELQRQAAKLVATKTLETGVLLNAVAAALQAVCWRTGI